MFKIYTALAVAAAALVATVAISHLRPDTAQGESTDGLERLLIPQDVNPPGPPIFYAQTIDDGYSAWVPVFFVRDPLVLAANDPNADLTPYGSQGSSVPIRGSVPRTVEGFLLRLRDETLGPGRIKFISLQNIENQTSPVWFVSRAAYDGMVGGTGTVTMNKLLALDPADLLKGEASHLLMNGSPPPTGNGNFNISAGGFLEDNRLFQATTVFKLVETAPNVIELDSVQVLNIQFMGQ